VLSLHGTPEGRWNRHPAEGAYRDMGAWVVTLDRPGYGRSSRQPGRVVGDVVPDSIALLDHLGIESLSVTGSSGGGPHALAVAAALGERVVRLRANTNPAPFDAADLDWFADMAEQNVREFQLAAGDERDLHADLVKQLAEMTARITDPEGLLGSDWALPESDRASLDDPASRDMFTLLGAELNRHGVWGWVDDDRAFLRPWATDLAQIRAETLIECGAQDVLVPVSHAQWLARNVPGSRLDLHEDQGHLGHPDDVLTATRWLIDRV
jgi:pimeloyl-ACP methyl ester carboxylesterase